MTGPDLKIHTLNSNKIRIFYPSRPLFTNFREPPLGIHVTSTYFCYLNSHGFFIASIVSLICPASFSLLAPAKSGLAINVTRSLDSAVTRAHSYQGFM